MNQSIKPINNFTNNINNYQYAYKKFGLQNIHEKDYQNNIYNNNASLPIISTIENKALKNIGQNKKHQPVKKNSYKFKIIFHLIIGIFNSVHSIHFIFSDYVRYIIISNFII